MQWHIVESDETHDLRYLNSIGLIIYINNILDAFFFTLTAQFYVFEKTIISVENKRRKNTIQEKSEFSKQIYN